MRRQLGVPPPTRRLGREPPAHPQSFHQLDHERDRYAEMSGGRTPRMARSDMASMVTRAPSRAPPAARRSSSSGMAVVLFAFASTAACPKTSQAVVAKAETRWSGALPALRSWLRREVLPSIATSSGRSGQTSRT